MKRLILGFLLAFSALSVQAQTKETVAGSWKCNVRPDGGQVFEFKLELVQKEKAVTGTAVRADGSSEIKNGTFEDGTLKITVSADAGTYDLEATLSGDKLNGLVTMPNGAKIKWDGERDGGIVGSWKIKAKAGENTRDFTLDVKKDGESYQIKMTSAAGESLDATKVTFADRKLKFSLPTGDGVYEVEGTLDGGKLAGTYLTPDGRKDTWDGSRM